MAAMENVPGLIVHPHWKLIKALLGSLPTPCKVVTSDLAQLGYMARNRCFLLFGVGPTERRFHDFHASALQTTVESVCYRVEDEVAMEQSKVPAHVREVLSKRSLLPDHLKLEALMTGVQDGKSVLELRIAKGRTLPTLVASYRRQSLLSPAHLARKGFLTWLLREPNSPGGVRFFDMFEGARALGFSTELCLPQDLDEAMSCVGNAVAPPQALIAFAAVSEEGIERIPLRRLIQCWLFGQIPLNLTMRVLIDGHWQLVDRRIQRRCGTSLHKAGYALAQALLFPLPDGDSLSNAADCLAFLPSIKWCGVLEIARVLHEDCVVIYVRLRCLRGGHVHRSGTANDGAPPWNVAKVFGNTSCHQGKYFPTLHRTIGALTFAAEECVSSR